MNRQASARHNREVTGNQFRDGTNIYQGDVHHYQTPPTVARPHVHTIPYPRNEEIIERKDLVDQLDKLLPLNNASKNYQSAALWGLGGSGKTQIALDYAYRRFQHDSCSVFWVHADNEATFMQDYKRIAKTLAVDDKLDGEKLLDTVRVAIESMSSWALILDNADNLALFGIGKTAKNSESLHNHVPRGPGGTVLWTSRDRHVAGPLVASTRGIQVAEMTEADSMHLLGNFIGKTIDSGEEEDAKKLVAELQYLPLAVSQAGAYIRKVSISIRDYLVRLTEGKSRWEIFQETEYDRHRRPDVSNSILETWNISIEQIRGEQGLADHLLHTIAYVDNQNIPVEIMVTSAGHYDEKEASQSQKAEQRVERAVARLVEFSFIGSRATEDGQRSFEMHKLVQEALRYGLHRRSCLGSEGQAPICGWPIAALEDKRNHQDEKYFSSIALQVITRLFPKSEVKTWEQCKKYVTHAVQVSEWSDIGGQELDAAYLLDRVSHYLHERASWMEKEVIDQKAFMMRKAALGETHLDTIRSMAELAISYLGQGRYQEAEELKDKVLDLRQKILGNEHPETIQAIENLATTYHQQGRYQEAEKLEVKVLDLRQKILGNEHPDTIWAIASLASTYHQQDRYQEAEKLEVKVLDLRQKIFGNEHPDTIWAIANLATTYHQQDRYQEAEELEVKVLDLRQKIFGNEHPDTIWAIANLATTYHQQGRYQEAEELRVKALDLRQKILGNEHPDTIQDIANLATTCYKQGRYQEAEKLEVKVLDLRQKTLGNEHPDTIQAIANLATTYHQQGRYQEAEELRVKALDLRQKILGNEHPETIRAIANLATICYKQGQYQEAKELRVKVLDLRQKILGNEHPETIRAMANLATTCYKQGRYQEAEELRVKALDLRQKILGNEHPETIRAIANLATICYKQGQYQEAKELRVKVLDLRQKILGNEHPEAIRAMANLATTCYKQGQYQEAKELRVKVLDLRQKILGNEHPETIRAMANLATTYYKQGRYQEAEELEVKVLDLRERILGKAHPNTIISMYNLALTWRKQCQYSKATALMRDCLEIRRQVLGPDHPETKEANDLLQEWDTAAWRTRYQRLLRKIKQWRLHK